MIYIFFYKLNYLIMNSKLTYSFYNKSQGRSSTSTTSTTTATSTTSCSEIIVNNKLIKFSKYKFTKNS